MVVAQRIATGSRYQTLLSVAVVVATLYFARAVLIPIALAVLLTFLLGPLVIRLRRWNAGRVTSVLIVVVLAFGVIAGLTGVVVLQLYDLASELPKYQANIEAKLHTLTPSHGGVFEGFNRLLKAIGDELGSSTGGGAASMHVTTTEQKPMVVQTLPPPQSPLQVVESVVLGVIGPLTTAGIVLIFTIFMLLEREDLRDRMIRLAGSGNLNVTTQALDDAAQRVSRYLVMQLLVNVTYGMPIGLGLYFIGVPNAALWGVLATMLRFIPYVGPWISALMPLALCFAIDPGWRMVMMTGGLFIVVELISNNMVEPWLYGTSTGISSMAVLVAAVFWAWLWGPVGLLLSTPLTVCVVVLGRYVPQLRFLSVLLGDAPGLTPAARYYQRMLASDFEDVTELVEDYLKDHTVEELYDEVVMPGLMMAEADRHAGELDASREAFILEHTHDLIDDLCSRELPAPQIAKAAETKSGKIEAPAKGSKAEAKKTEHVEKVEKAGEVDPQQQAVDREMARQMVSVAIVPARDPADELVGRMLAHLLELRGVGAKPLSAERLSGERLEAVANLKVGVVCVSALPPQAVTHARFMGKRLRGLLPEAKIVVGLWRVRGDAAKLRSAVTAQASDSVATTLAQALEFIVPLAMAKISDAMLPAPIPANESERLKELRRLDLLSPGTDETLEAAAKDLAKIFDAPIAMASVIDEKRQVWKGQVGLPDQLAKRTESPRDTSICGHVAAVNHTLVVEDASRDKRFANNPVVKEQDIRFYAGAPLRTKSGQAIGVLCVIDHRPRTFTERDRSIMQAIADHAMRDIEKRHRSDVISELTSGIKTMITGEIPQPKPGNT